MVEITGNHRKSPEITGQESDYLAGTIQFVFRQLSYFQWFACAKSNCNAVETHHQMVPNLCHDEISFCCKHGATFASFRRSSTESFRLR